MNERIRELLKQATKEVDPYDRVWVFSKVDQAKFAELIVQECVSVLQNVPNGYNDYRSQIEDTDRRYCISYIKKHFGVEE
jgi:hypothetical protein